MTALAVAHDRAVAYDLGAVIRAHVESGDEPDPAAIAADVLSSMTEDDLREALRECLPLRVKQVISAYRLKATRHPAGESPRWADVAAAAENGELDILRMRVAVGSTWKFYGDCSRDDVLALASMRRENAARNSAAADAHERVATAMTKRHALTVKALPVDVVRGAFDA